MTTDGDANSIEFAALFPPSTDAQWRGLVEKVLKGADFDKRLVRSTADGLKVQPLYRREDRTRADIDVAQTVAPGGAGGWDVRTVVVAATGAEARAVIADELAGGATSITVKIDAPGQWGLPMDALALALETVDLEGTGVALEAGPVAPAAAQALSAIWRTRGVDQAKVFGSFGDDPIGDYARFGGSPLGIAADLAAAGALVRTSLDMPYVSALSVRGTTHHRAGASEAQELAAVLATTVAYLRAAEQAGVAPDRALAKIQIVLAVDTDQVMGLAKFRAARRLLAEVAGAVDAPNAARSILLVAETAERMFSQRDAWVNILRSTLAVATAAMAGAQVITTLPHTEALGRPDAFARRIARNIHHVLADESGLGRVADPAAGSFTIEALSRALVVEAWQQFQAIEAAGGLVQLLERGTWQAQVASVAARRAQDIATGRLELTGCSAFPRLGDDGVTFVPWSTLGDARAFSPIGPAIVPLPLRRLSQPFDGLRDKADAAAKRGLSLKVFFATLGAQASYVARATWTRSFLAAGGIDTIEPGPLLTSPEAGRAFADSGADIAVLVGDDVTYGESGEAVTQLLKTAGAVKVWLAGRPKAQEAALLQAGVDGFIAAGQDMVVTLEALQRDLGV